MLGWLVGWLVAVYLDHEHEGHTPDPRICQKRFLNKSENFNEESEIEVGITEKFSAQGELALRLTSDFVGEVVQQTTE
jgi:hypothetical protein